MICPLLHPTLLVCTQGRTLVTAWVGDSRGVLGRETMSGEMEAIDLTDDHKPTNTEERARILASNGRVER